MRVNEARALCATLEVLPWDDDIIARAVTEMSALLLEASPQVTPVMGAPGVWWVGANGFEFMGGDRQLAYALLRIARRWHPRSRVAIADSCVAARAATWAGASFERSTDDRTLVAIVPSGRDATYLSRVPLALVPMDDELRDALRALGLRMAGELAALGVDDVERRWGPEGINAWRLAAGDDPRRPGLLRRDAVPAVDVELPAPVETMEPVLFLVRAALDRLVREITSRGRAAAAVAITLTLDDARGALPRHAQASALAHTVTREVRPARPLARVAPLFERCRTLLDGWTLTAPVTAVSVTIPATAPLPGDQGDLLDTSWKDAAALEAALVRLRAELGPRVVVHPVPHDSHRPERSGAWVEADIGPWATKATTPSRPTAQSSQPTATLAFRLLDPPEAAEVETNAEAAPATLTWRGRHLTILSVLGPERLSGDWWRDPYSRDYWRCTTSDGELLLFLDRASPAAGWHVQGWYD
jgi:protein ImuB